MYRTSHWGALPCLLLFALAGCASLHEGAKDSAEQGPLKETVPGLRRLTNPEPELGAAGPTPVNQDIESVSTVLSPECEKREISLTECIALALENGRTGQYFDRAGSGRRTSVAGLSPGSGQPAVTDSIRVLAYSPAVFGADIEKSLSRFDVIWQSGFVFNHFDRPVGLDSLFPGGFPGLNNSTVSSFANSFGIFNGIGTADTAEFRSELIKPLPTGGTAGISFRTDYFQTNNNLNFGVPFLAQPLTIQNPFIFSPAYRPQLDFTFEQPLLRGFGVFTNEVRDTHPGSLRNPFSTEVRAPGILLARVTYEQSKLDFKRQVHELLYTVEEAYWALYAAYWDLHSREVGMKQALTAWQIAKKQFDKGGMSAGNLAQLEQQYQLFRIQRLQALGQGGLGRTGVLEAERRLRYVLGLPAEDGTRLIPSDTPTDTPTSKDWKSALAEARLQRPELLQVQEEIKAAELNLRRAKDLRLPELRFLARYNINGLGQTLGSSLDNFATGRYNDWDVGLVMNVPLGARLGNAEVSQANLKLVQRYAFLRDQEAKVILSLQRSYRDVVQAGEEIRLRKLRRLAAATELAERYKVFQSGAGKEAVLTVLLDAQRNWIDALRDEQGAICNYNIALADFESQKGTIMEYDNVHLGEGPLPAYAQSRASKHIREFQRAITIRNIPTSIHGEGDSAFRAPEGFLSECRVGSLPVLLEQTKGLPEQLAPSSPTPPSVLPRAELLPPMDQSALENVLLKR